MSLLVPAIEKQKKNLKVKREKNLVVKLFFMKNLFSLD